MGRWCEAIWVRANLPCPEAAAAASRRKEVRYPEAGGTVQRTPWGSLTGFPKGAQVGT
jgi:hypothetical protein